MTAKKRAWLVSLTLAVVSSSAMTGLLTYWDENGFDLWKDLPKLALVILTAAGPWLAKNPEPQDPTE
jgi:hypothetical protein